MYDLSADAEQQLDLAEANPEKLGELKVEFNALFEEAREEGTVWEGLPEYEADIAGHNKHEEYLRNQKQFLTK
ncbi:MAG: hypothetical protein O2887_11780 [Bacteroidetes bacterium]|nr:hypothetical protein [Bacteroidota bacterium]MDA1121151.1 hypothetical protein [Bacteroidota bacterium]